jgi:mannan endo-1,4-beta-mannosidase
MRILPYRGSHDQTAASYSDAYNAAIPLVRSVYQGPLVVDIPGWGQETNTAVAASALLSDSHLVFSAHIYPQAYNQVAGRPVSPADVQDLFIQSGRPCIIGEFGDIIEASGSPSPRTVNTNTSTSTPSSLLAEEEDKDQCDVRAVVQAARAVGFQGVYGWAWNGDGGSLNMVAPSWVFVPTSVTYVPTDYFWSILELL